MTDTVSSAPQRARLQARAGKNTFINDTFAACGHGAALDVPDGGIVSVDGLTLVHPGTGATHPVLAIGEESGKNAAAGMVLNTKGKGLHIVDPAGVAFIMCGNGAVLNINPAIDTYQGPNDQPEIHGCTVNGSFRKVP